MKKSYVFFTGGGSGGHVMPALTLITSLKKTACEIHYIGGYNSIERDLVKPYELNYHPIHNGKLRRYLSIDNLKDFFKVWIGVFQSFFLLLKYPRQKTLVFSTGGFVSLPVVIAAWLQRKTIYVHEQTSRVGLANKIASMFATKVFVSFEESKNFFPLGKTFYSGYPLRDECFTSEARDVVINGRSLSQINKPIFLITGGGNGSHLLNELIRKNLNLLGERFFIVHQVGKANAETYLKLNNENYQSVSFIGPEMIDLYKMSTVILSRSGAGTVCELIAIGKKSIFIPLKIAQKNEQFYNAVEARKKLGSIIIEENELTDESLFKALDQFSYPNPRQQVQSENGKSILLNEILIFTQK